MIRDVRLGSGERLRDHVELSRVAPGEQPAMHQDVETVAPVGMHDHDRREPQLRALSASRGVAVHDGVEAERELARHELRHQHEHAQRRRMQVLELVDGREGTHFDGFSVSPADDDLQVTCWVKVAFTHASGFPHTQGLGDGFETTKFQWKTCI